MENCKVICCPVFGGIKIARLNKKGDKVVDFKDGIEDVFSALTIRALIYPVDGDNVVVSTDTLTAHHAVYGNIKSVITVKVMLEDNEEEK